MRQSRGQAYIEFPWCSGAVLPSWPPIVHLPLCTSSQATFLLTDPHLAARPHIVVTATFACICAHEAAVTTITQRNRGKPWHCSHGQNHALATGSPQGNTLMERSFLRCQRHAGAARPQKLSRSVTSSEIVTATALVAVFKVLVAYIRANQSDQREIVMRIMDRYAVMHIPSWLANLPSINAFPCP